MIRVWVISLLVLFVWVVEGGCRPQMISNSNLLDKDLKLLIGNCDKVSSNLEIPWVKFHPKNGFMERSTLLDMVYINSFVYAISNQGILYELNSTTGEEVAHLNLFKEATFIKVGNLTVKEIFDGEAKKVLLALNVVVEIEEEGKKSFGWVFDITDPQQFRAIPDLSPKGITVIIAKPLFVYHPNGYWSIAWAGEVKNQGLLQFIPLETSKAVIEYKIGDGISTLEGVDLGSRGIVDRVYMGDVKGNLWGLNLKSDLKPSLISATAEPKKIASFLSILKIWVVKANQGQGINIYVLARNEKGEQRVLMVWDKLELETDRDLDPIVIDKIETLTMMIRFGRAIFVPQKDTPPFVMNLANHKLVKVIWNPVTSIYPKDPKQTKETDQGINEAVKLLWDPKNHQDILIILNSNCELKGSVAKVNQDRLGRQAIYRKQ